MIKEIHLVFEDKSVRLLVQESQVLVPMKDPQYQLEVLADLEKLDLKTPAERELKFHRVQQVHLELMVVKAANDFKELLERLIQQAERVQQVAHSMTV